MKHKIGVIALLCLSLGFAGMGCGRHKTWHRVVAYKWGKPGLACELFLEPSIPSLDRAPITVFFSNEHGKPLKKLSVTADFSMPSMTMPKNTVVLPEVRPGVYSSHYQLTMAGLWRVTIHAARNGRPLIDHTLDIDAH